MEYFALVSIFFWISNIALFLMLLCEQTYLVQIKEYRLDRLKSYFKNEFKINKWVAFIYFFKFLALVSSIWLVFQPNLINITLIIIDFGLNVYLTSRVIQSLISKKIQFPKKSIRNLLILSIGMLFFVLPLIYSLNLSFKAENIYKGSTNNSIYDFNGLGEDVKKIANNEFKGEISNNEEIKRIDLGLFLVTFLTFTNNFLLLFTFPIVIIGMLMTSPIAAYKRKRIINKAKAKITSMDNLKVIGITGSYGKTSTKEILVKILSQKFKVGFTKENMNTEVGIALSVINNLPVDSDFFVYEAGAYKKGEIQKCVKIASLDYAIITNVGKAHLDIFGTIENIAEAKFELLTGLKTNGKAILNNDNFYTKEMAKNIANETFFNHTDEDQEFIEPNSKNILSIYDIIWNEPDVKFKVKFKDQDILMETKLVGRLQIKNLAAAILCCLNCGFELEELKIIIKDLIFESSHYKVYTGKSGVRILDDGYNSNPEGFKSALMHLKLSTTKIKILMTRGIPEIGNSIKNIYFNLKDEIYSSANIFITTDKDFFEIIELDKPKNFKSFLIDNEFEDIKTKLSPYLSIDSTILIEGRINPKLHEFIKEYNSK